MKKVLFATTAFTALAVGGTAMADITLYGSARLGLYYDEAADDELTTTSRTRFGVTMSGETDSGITFGADMRVDNATDPLDGTEDGRAGEAFVSGAFGTLTYGDTSGADEQWVGDLYGNLSLTGLQDYNETAFLSNGGSYADDDSFSFAPDPEARPTVRYDFDLAGFGFSLSADHDLDSVGVGTGYAGPVAGFDIEVGLGYYNFSSFQVATPTTVTADIDNDGVLETVAVEGDTLTDVEDGEQFTAMLGFGVLGADMNVIYNKATSQNDDEFETIGVGAEYAFDAITVGAFYRNITTARGSLDALDGEDVWGLTGEYDLGGGAAIAGGVVQDYDDSWIGDFGINMSF